MSQKSLHSPAQLTSVQPRSTTTQTPPSAAVVRLLTIGLVGLLALVGWGCSDDSPTEPTNTLVVEGNVAFQSTSIQNFTMTVDGLMQITLDSLTPQGPDGTVFDVTNVGIGFSLGRQVEGQCLTSGAIAFRIGDHASYGLDQGEYCLYFYDAGFIPADGSYDYRASVDMTNF